MRIYKIRISAGRSASGSLLASFGSVRGRCSLAGYAYIRTCTFIARTHSALVACGHYPHDHVIIPSTSWPPTHN